MNTREDEKEDKKVKDKEKTKKLKIQRRKPFHLGQISRQYIYTHKL